MAKNPILHITIAHKKTRPGLLWSSQIYDVQAVHFFLDAIYDAITFNICG